MPNRQVRLQNDVPAELRAGLADLEDELGIDEEFDADVLAEVAERIEAGPLPFDRKDMTALPFVSIDPAGSMDLDQIMHIERTPGGYRIWYGIADVASWVVPGGAIDRAARKRGQTFYGPNMRVPLHPPMLSEGAASLLADGVARPAQLWRVDLDTVGVIQNATVRRAMVVNTEKLTYIEAQKRLDDGTASESLQLLREVGMLRERIEDERGGVSLHLPEQLIDTEGPNWRLRFRESLPVEGWNAQISLMTGASAAEIMLQYGLGILRTLPPADDYSIRKLRNVAKGLEIPWPKKMGYPDFVRSLDPSLPEHQAMMNACTLLFRGADYTVIALDDDDQLMVHGALALRYAHVTAPLRRLIDRFVGEICVSVSSEIDVPDWAVEALDDLPKLMRDSDRKAKAFERGAVNLVEALVLSGRKGEKFLGTVIEIDRRFPNKGFATLPMLAIEAPVTGNKLELGEQFEFELTKANVRTGDVSLTVR